MRLPLTLTYPADPTRRPVYEPDYSHPLFYIPVGMAYIAMLSFFVTHLAIARECSPRVSYIGIQSCIIDIYRDSNREIGVQQLTDLTMVVVAKAVAHLPSLVANAFFRPNR